jgi:hypothetical protein
MAQTSLTAANTDTPPAVSPPAGVVGQLSYSGTPRAPDGSTMPDDYAPAMADPVRRMAIFEEMRASDSAVAGAIDARRQEINAANWVLATEDKSDLGTQILEFVEDNLYPVLDDIIRWVAGGGIQYGFGCVEPVYAWRDAPRASVIGRGKVRRPVRSQMRAIYLEKIAHIRQRSIETFKISPTGDLQTVVQDAFNGSTYRRTEIPARKALIWTYDRQGDDRWGVPPTRHCYKAWSFKQQIEKLNILHTDRFAVGLPIITSGEGWGARERAAAAEFWRTFRSATENFLMLPPGGSATIATDDGKTSGAMLEWLKYYDLCIAKTYVTQSSELGSTETGSRAVGDTMVEQLGALIQGDCEDLAAILNGEQLIKGLVDWNFGPQQIYPQFSPSQRVKANGKLATLAKPLIDAGLLHGRAEDEIVVRDELGLPAVPLETLKAEAAARDAAKQALADAAATAAERNAGGAGGAQPTPAATTDDAPPSRAPLKVAATREPRPVRHLALEPTAEGGPAPAATGQSWRHPELEQWESRILKPDVLLRDLDLQASRLAGEVQDVLAAIDDNLEEQAVALASQGPSTLSAGVRDIAVPERLRTKLRAVLFEAAQRSRDYGAKAVRNEIARQLGPEGIGPQRDSFWPATMEAPTFFARVATRIRELVAGAPDPSPQDLLLAAEVDRAVEEEVSRRESSIRSAMMTTIAQAAGAAVDALAQIVRAAASTALVGLSTGRTQANVQGVVNVGFGVGRSDAAEAIISADAGDATAQPAGEGAGGDTRSGLRDADGNAVGLVAKVYSAVMDFGTCDECAKWDGAEFPIDHPEDYTGVQCPNPRCAGGYSRCRCVWIYITSRESVPLLPAAKGPDPIRSNAAAAAGAFSRELEPTISALKADFATQLDAFRGNVEQMLSALGTREPVALTVNVEAAKGSVRKTIEGPGGQTFTVTEERGAE